MAAIPMRGGPGAPTLLLLVVLLVAAGLRFTGRDWDGGHHLHPDERFLSMVVSAERFPASVGVWLDESRSPLNPRNVGFPFFAYGTLPTTIVTSAGHVTGRTDLPQLTLLGRGASAAASLGSVWLVFLVARRLYGDLRVAGLAALLLATAVLPIQHAHFFVVDPFAVFFITAAAWALAGPPRVYRYPLVGLFFGLALACKLSIASFAVVIGVVALGDFFTPVRPGTRRSLAGPLMRATVRVLLVMATAFAAFRLAQPDAFQGPGLLDIWPSARWLDNLKTARGLVDGSIDTPPGVQWANRTPFWFAWWNLVVWGMGPALGLTAWAGWAAATWQTFRGRTARHLIPVLWTGLLFLHQGGQFVMAARYLLPIYPMLAMLAAWLLVTLWDRAAARDTASALHWRRVAAGGLASLVVLTTCVWAVAFTAIYRRPNTRVEASRWVYDHVPGGATIAIEHWDDPLPLRLEGRSPENYTGVVLPLYDDDTPNKLDTLIERLEQADYVILASNRLYDSIPRLPMRYPLAIRYYDALFSGTLGFERVADLTSYPSIGPLRIPDQSAEEAFSVYDHARVQIFRKTARWSPLRARALLDDVDWHAVIRLPAVRARAFGTGLMLTPSAREEARAGGTWSALFNPGDLANRWPLVTWTLTLALLGLVTFPLVSLALGRLPDRGWLLARTAGLLLLGYAAWLPASLRWLPFTRSTLAGVVLALAAGSALVVWRRRRGYWRFLVERRALLLKEECLFWACFAAFAAIRASNPDLWHPHLGGEKPMDFAYLNAVIRSEYFPPYDPWFAGGYLNYYYFGFVLVAAIVKLTGIVPEVAYNLAIPTLFALSATATFSVVHALVSAIGPAPADAADAARPRFAFASGVAGAAFVMLIGNLVEVRLLVRTLLDRTWSELPLSTWYWNASRAIPHPVTEPGPITEFPFFTFLYGDLHAHAMSLPFTLLVLALVVSFVLPPSTAGQSQPAHGPARLGLLALTLGALFPLNAWDYPTYVCVVAAGLTLGTWAEPAPARSFGTIVKAAIVRVLAVLIAGRVLFWPFYTHYGQAYGTFALWQGSRTGLTAYVLIHGVFLFLIASALLWLAATRGRQVRRQAPAAAALGLAGLFAATALLLTAVVELVVLEGDIGRMNTVFKFYFQAWVLFSIAAATGLAVVTLGWRGRPAPRPQWLIVVGFVWSSLVFWLVAGGSVYPVLATWARSQDRFVSDAGFTLDGQAFMRRAVHVESTSAFPLAPDLDAINWLRANVTGSPVIAEAHAPEYHWGSRVSVHTGLPTILGWRHHQTQQRALLPADVVSRRIPDIDALYSSPDDDVARTILDRYDVDYIYLGPLERILYPAQGLAKFDGDGPHWQLVYEQGDVRIYRVRR